MARSAIFAFAIAALLALSGCHSAAVPQSVPPPANEPAATVPPVPAPQPASPAPQPASPAPQPTSPATAPEKAAPPPPPAPSTAPTSTAAASPVSPATRPTAKPSSPNATAAPKQAVSPPVAPESKAQSAPAPPKASSLDLNSLEQKLKDTRAIGVFTKLSLKNQVDDLLSEFRAFHKGAAKTPQSELRQRYDLLIMKVLSLLQNGDPQLASAIASSREALWGILMDPQKFANI
jgi:hypothetical protein